ncbi:2Fe-2S iron-sulfur cluster-binding protein [Flavobacteriales bacterium]|nr:2Fe-2S iron-sulfur cluster-binding protein [Flavobacteriales bacterium]MDA9328914.1 2Fe-2S iron-sulfur cluster-binding protein [Flavobacteriales bacterium]
MFHSLAIKNIQKETTEAVSIEFEVPSSLKEDFQFLSGQFLTLKTEIGGNEVRRSYSICSSPKSGILKVVVKQVENGVFSTYANSALKNNDTIEVGVPAGGFVVNTEADNNKNYTLIAAGSGITPVISIAKTILEDEPNSSVNLFYGNKTASQTIFKTELEELSKEYNNRLNFHLLFSAEKGDSRFHSGRIEGRRIKKIFKEFAPISNTNEVFICGPQEMTEAIRDFLIKKHKYPVNQIHFELFTTTLKKAKSNSKSNKSSLVTATIDGDTFEFTVKPGETILDAGTKNGVDIPFSCQGGVCGACKCIKGEGELTMDNNIVLSDDEVASGQYLACQSKVKSESVKISFDF